MRTTLYLLQRVGVLLGTIWAAITVNFLIPHLMPGTPVDALMAKFRTAGGLNPSAMHAIKLMLGISTASLPVQYVQYLGQALRFQFGVSYTYFPYSVSYMIGKSLPWTLGLVGVSTVIAFAIGTLAGVSVGVHRGRRIDTVLTTVSSFTSAFPYFWFALLLLYVGAFLFRWFPLGGAYDTGTLPTLSWAFAVGVLHHSVLPAVTVVVSSFGGWLLGMRNNIINVLSEDYVTLAEAKGLPERKIAWDYVGRNALLPNITGFGMALGFVVGGSILTEVVFAYPGLGNLLYTAVVNEDFPLMQGIFLIIVLSVVAANFLVDLLYMLLDPRTRTETTA